MRNHVSYCLIIGILLSLAPAVAQSEDIDDGRRELISRWDPEGLPQPSVVERQAQELLSRPLDQQSEAELTELAKQANAAANFVGFIFEEYQDYYRANSRYDFVKKKIVPSHNTYLELGNRLKGYRNQAYFSLAAKAKEKGDQLRAFFLFRDAFRLSSFTEPEGDHKGTRYWAEIEMKKLLGIEGIDSYIYWK